MDRPTMRVWGCLECGTLSENLSAGDRCPECKDGLVTELGGTPTEEKAIALLAFARKDATESIETYGTFAGAVAALLLGIAIAAAASGSGLMALLVVFYLSVLGAIIGRLVALPVHRRLRPHSRLQPVYNAWLRRILLISVAVWGVAGGILIAVSTSATRGALRHAVGSLWALIGG